MTDDDMHRLEACRQKWKQIFDVFYSGTSNLSFEFDSEALSLANDWSGKKEAEIEDCDDATEADVKGALTTRMSDYIYKLSALYEVDKISQNDVSTLVDAPITITVESVQKAIAIIDNLLTQLTDNLLISLTKLNVSKKLETVTNIIRKKADASGWVQHRILLQYSNMLANELNAVLGTASGLELIEYKREGKATYYRLKTAEKVAAVAIPVQTTVCASK